MEVESKDRIARIRDLNDAFRRSFSGGKVVMTCGVAELPAMVKAAALTKVAECNEFAIDYDANCEFGSEDPADPAKTTRVLTLMLASEY